MKKLRGLKEPTVKNVEVISRFRIELGTTVISNKPILVLQFLLDEEPVAFAFSEEDAQQFIQDLLTATALFFGDKPPGADLN